MWALRMLQAVPGLALMALGDTRPLLTAGTLRATALGLALGGALAGLGVEGIAAAGVLGEVASLLYVAWRADRDLPGLARLFLGRCLMLLPAGFAALAVPLVFPAPSSAMTSIAIAVALSGLLGAALATTMPGLRTGLAAFRQGTATAPAAPDHT
jgi:hypothetical protein